MAGTAIIGALLCGHQSLVSIVPTARIKGGRLPENSPVPAILVRLISLIDRQPLILAGWERSTARIAVMIRAGTYAQQGEIIRLVRHACRGFTGDIADCRRVSVRTAGLGPDVTGPGNSFEQTQDFRVSFDAPI